LNSKSLLDRNYTNNVNNIIIKTVTAIHHLSTLALCLIEQLFTLFTISSAKQQQIRASNKVKFNHSLENNKILPSIKNE
ncbi:hypothetical protein DOY81_009325, partial [Sarcophaga bullata]